VVERRQLEGSREAVPRLTLQRNCN
jgi:hypothetical protein